MSTQSKTWTKNEIEFLKNNYKNLDQNSLIKTLQSRSWGSILSKASKLQLTGQYIEWTPKEIQFLQDNYSTASQQYLTTNLQNRKWKSIRHQASNLKLERISILRKADLSTLLEETPTTYYWIGFLMADGSFSDRRLHLGVAHKDLKHLQKFKKFVSSRNKITKTKNKHGKIHYRIKITCVNIIKTFREKFKVSSRKTYEPCSISHIENKDLLFSLIIGFLDGDGCVTKNKNSRNCHRINFIGHPSWLNNFCFMKQFIYNYFNFENETTPPKIKKHWTRLPQDETKTKKEYFVASFNIDKTNLILAIKDKAQQLNLPFLKRKLGKIGS